MCTMCKRIASYILHCHECIKTPFACWVVSEEVSCHAYRSTMLCRCVVWHWRLLLHLAANAFSFIEWDANVTLPCLARQLRRSSQNPPASCAYCDGWWFCRQFTRRSSKWHFSNLHPVAIHFGLCGHYAQCSFGRNSIVLPQYPVSNQNITIHSSTNLHYNLIFIHLGKHYQIYKYKVTHYH